MAMAAPLSAEEFLRNSEPTDAGAQGVATQPPPLTAEEFLAVSESGEPQFEDPRQFRFRSASSMYDWRNPRPSRDEYFDNKTELAQLEKEGYAMQGPGIKAGLTDMFISFGDAVATALWKYDPDNEGQITPRNAADFVTRGLYSNLQGQPSTYNPGMAMIDTGARLGASLAGSNAFNKDFYKTLARGMAANNPKYRVEETGEFVYPGAMMPDAGVGDTTFDLVQMYQQQGKTLRPVNEEDLKDLEYEQFLQKLDATQELETLLESEIDAPIATIATSLGAPEALFDAAALPENATTLDRVTVEGLDRLRSFAVGVSDAADRAVVAAGLAPKGYRGTDTLWGEPRKPNQAQAMLGSMAVDPGMWLTGVLAPARWGVTALAKGATARTLEVTGKAATWAGNLGKQGESAQRQIQKLKRRATRMAAIVGGVTGANIVSRGSESDEFAQGVKLLNAGLGTYAAFAFGAGVLRGYGRIAGKTSHVLRESIGPGTQLDKGARAAVAANSDVPLRYRDPLSRPSVYTSMESTPARLANDPSLTPRARKFFGALADWRAVQAARLAGAGVSGGAKGAILNLPFSEPMRAAGEDDAANLMIAMGVGLGTPLGAAGRVGQAAGRRASAADSDVGRMLAEVQQTGTQRPPKRANPDAEVMRTLTEAELAGGDVSAMVNNLSPDQLNEFAAVQGYFRDTTDFVPLNAADFEANRSVLNPNSADPIFLHAPEGERPRVFVNVEDAKSIKAGDLGRAFLKSESLPDRQVAAMVSGVETLYTPEQIAAREREIARAAVEQRYAKQNVKVGPNDPEVDLRLEMLRAESQREFGNPNFWSRQAIAADDLSRGIVDWNRMRRALPLGENPVTFLENVLGAQARGLQISGVRIDPETGRPLDTPDSLKRTNPAAADDPAVAQGLKNYTEGYNKMRRDPANETPVPEPVSPERAAAIELSMTDAPLRARQIMDLAGGPDGPALSPTDTTFGWRQEGNRRVLAGMRLPDRIRLANHWRNELPKIDEIQRYMDSGEYVVMRWDTIGKSADVTKREAPQYGAITREGRILRWNATTGRKREKYKGGGNLNVQIADYTTLRNNVLTVIEKKHPALDPARGGPGYSIEGIMADVDVYLANRRTGADLSTGLTPERLRVTEGLVEGRRGNIFTGVLDSDGIVREARIELVETIQPTGRRSHNMVGNNADGTFTQPPPKPMPDMGSDVVPPSQQ
jgi:hypothetical protein